MAWIFALIASSCFAALDVSTKATSGSGTPADPWRGWEVATPWAPETEFYFPTGTYAYGVSPNFMLTGIALRGEAGTVLKFEGVGNAVVFDNPGTDPLLWKRWTMNVRMENFIVQGTAAATNGLFVRGARNGIFKHLSVRDVASAGFWCEACVTNIVENLRVTHHEMPNDAFNVVPAYGIVLAARGGDWTTTTTIVNPVIEGTGQIGIWLKANCYGNTVINGTSEGNIGKGMQIDSWLNTVINTDFEANAGTDVEINHNNNELQGVESGGVIDVKAGQMNRLRGRFQTVKIASSVDLTDVSGAYIASLQDSAQDTVKFGYQTLDGGMMKQSFTGSPQEPMNQITPVNGAVTLDARRGSLYWLALFSDVAETITGAFNGQKITVRLQQDATGTHAFTSPQFDVQPQVNQAAGSYTYVSCRWNAQVNKCQVVPS